MDCSRVMSFLLLSESIRTPNDAQCWWSAQSTPKGTKSFEELYPIWERLDCNRANGAGVNLVNGDYSWGVRILDRKWRDFVSVHEVTVASNLDRMLCDDLRAVGSDLDLRRSISSGSMLFEKMMVAGS